MDLNLKIKPVMYLGSIPVYIDENVPTWMFGYFIHIPVWWTHD